MMMGTGIRVRRAEQRMSGFGVERTGWSHVHDANDPFETCVIWLPCADQGYGEEGYGVR
jgi:hypothetical protein